MKYTEGFLIMLVCSLLFSCKSTSSDFQPKEPLKTPAPFFRENKWKNNDGFSIAIIPDTQSYVDIKSQAFSRHAYAIDQWEIYYRQTKFIAENSVQNGGDFSFALHVGDHVEHRSEKPIEWTLAAKALSNLNDNIPFLVVPGNHDCDRWGLRQQLIGSTWYSKTFGCDSIFFKDKEWYKGSFNNSLNSWAIFKGAEKDILVIGLEINPNEETIKWAQNIVDTHKGLPTIILTHVYLSTEQESLLDETEEYEIIETNGVEYRKNINFQFAKDQYNKRNSGWNTEKLWEDFISVNNQIFFVICGHVSTFEKGCGYRIDTNKDGFTTYSIFSDFQFFKNYLETMEIPYKKKPRDCGDGWMSVLDIDIADKKIDLSCFNTETGTFMKGEPFEMTFPIDWDWDERFSEN